MGTHPDVGKLVDEADKAAYHQHLDQSKPADPADHSELDPADLEPFNPAAPPKKAKSTVSSTVSKK